jgi:Na+/melibiose symporter-like transporter
VFFVNVPICVFAMFVTRRELPESAPVGGDRRIDYTGSAVLSVALLSLLLAMDEGAEEGWTHGPILALFAVTVLGLVSFVFLERRAKAHALVPSDVMQNRVFTAACLATLMLSAIFFSALLYLPQFMQKALGYSALKSGAGLLPMMGVFAVTSFIAGPLYARIGAKPIESVGAGCLAVGILLVSFVDRGSGYGDIVPGMILLGIGVGFFVSSITTVAVTALDPSRASLAGAIVYMFQIAGGAVGLGLNTAIVTSGADHPSLVSFVGGIGDAFKVDAALGVVGFVIALLFIGGRSTSRIHARCAGITPTASRTSPGLFASGPSHSSASGSRAADAAMASSTWPRS